ncbi:unnamed protein product [Dibothriocephalus latus]|uniref:DUF5737 domain-containing protein n=1 Tax=Dibothriocephalus latus TaxID=60516 RepID=A0A3P6TWK9_DIBLA|nr:unnamed protein product [Dibothriocephalus latus]
MAHAPVRFEEIGFNYGFVPININSKKGYNVVYHLFMDRMLEDGRLVLIKGNENKIMLKDIEGPVEDREKVIIYSPDITNFYKFNLTNKLVGFGIEAYRRSKTGYWFLAFQREGQLQAFCDFLNWVIYGKLPRRRAVQPAYHPAYRPVSRTLQLPELRNEAQQKLFLRCSTNTPVLLLRCHSQGGRPEEFDYFRIGSVRCLEPPLHQYTLIAIKTELPV